MKKVFLILAATICLFYFGNVISVNAQNERTLKGRPVDAKLCNQEHGQRLELYTDGKCKVIVGVNSGWGKYTLNPNRTKITINWDNETENRGDVIVNNNGFVVNLTIEGVRYTPCK